MPGALLDTHALLWLVNGDNLADEALDAIAECQNVNALFVSPISAWEIALAVQKPALARRPNLQGSPAAAWFQQAIRFVGARLIPIHQRIALEAANVAEIYARKDPGDCLLIATARVRRIPIITRDKPMCDLAYEMPDYLDVIRC